MPTHSRAHSWAGAAQPVVSVVAYSTHHQHQPHPQAQDKYGHATPQSCASYSNDHSTKNDTALLVQWFDRSTTLPQANSNTHSRMRSIPAITMPSQYLPLPYAIPKPKAAGLGMENTLQRTPRTSSMMGRSLTVKTSPLPLLPCPPNLVYNPRNELQRRTSPTAASFSSSSLTSPSSSISPSTPMSAASYSSTASSATSAATGGDTYYTPRLSAERKMSASDDTPEQVYVLTLKTSDEIAQQMQSLRQKWFPADRLKVPAHITLFHALPASQIAHIIDVIESLSTVTPRFEISTGRITKSRTGVFVALDAGLDQTKHVFSKLRSQLWEFLSEQDRAFHRAHWTIQNKEGDSARVEEAFRDTHRLGTGLGWATGLALWRYESDGGWSKEREFGFARCGRERDGSGSPLNQEGDGWPMY